MADNFLQITKREQAAVLRAVAAQVKRLPIVLEKDIWVCWALCALFSMPDRPQMAFKGGTSLSKVYKVIERFSEDVDITIDYRSLSPHFDPFDAALSNSQRRKACEKLQDQVGELVREKIAPFFAECIARETANGVSIEIEQGGDAIRVVYDSALQSAELNRYMQSSILVEFGGRNTTEPMQIHAISPYARGHTVDLFFPEAEIPVLAGERTFWEKATLIHVECRRDDFVARVARKSRHWHDLAMLADHPIGLNAQADIGLLRDVVKHKKVFFPSAHAHYDECISGKIMLVPSATSLLALEEDYRAMESAGMFPEAALPMSNILSRLSALQMKINQAARAIGKP
jgi:Nucleotidyl transferase AbiEii toxin, Type IV TA system